MRTYSGTRIDALFVKAASIGHTHLVNAAIAYSRPPCCCRSRPLHAATSPSHPSGETVLRPSIMSVVSAGASTVTNDPFSKRPQLSLYNQQRLPGWQPKVTVNGLVAFFLFWGILFIPMVTHFTITHPLLLAYSGLI